MTDLPVFAQYYELERYLFETVGPRLRSTGQLDAFDFFCIVAWKANRARSLVAANLKRQHPHLETAVGLLTSELIRETTNRARFLCLRSERWRFSLPMASAVLTVLDPDHFTIYDRRVCGILGRFHAIDSPSWKHGDRVWPRYQEYIEAVRGCPGATLREKDKHLWGQSFYQQLTRDVRAGFPGRR